MSGKDKNTEDKIGYGEFFIGRMYFYNIFTSYEAIGYIFGVGVARVNLLTEFMGVSAIKAIGIHDRMVWAARQIADEVIDPL